MSEIYGNKSLSDLEAVEYGDGDQGGMAPILEEPALGALLREAVDDGDKLPSLSAIEWIEREVSIPGDHHPSLQQLRESYAARLAASLQADSGAVNLGSLISKARGARGWTMGDVAAKTGLPALQLENLEGNRLPVWRLPARAVRMLCLELNITRDAVLACTLVRIYASPAGAFGRVDEDPEIRYKALSAALTESEDDEMREYRDWHHEFSASFAAE